MTNVFNQRISDLRCKMRERGIDAVIVPQTDPHHGEYLAAHWQVRRWLTGFTGSAGDVVVTLDEARLWADSRYWLQSAMQVADTEILVMEDGKPETPSIAQYLCSELPDGACVGVDGLLFSVSETDALRCQLAASGKKLVTDFDAADGLWTDRPDLPSSPVTIHPEKYAGEGAAHKMGRVMAGVHAQGADAVFVSDLAEVAWLLNIRSTDVPCNPVLTSYFYLSDRDKVLFVDQSKITCDVADYLASLQVVVRPYGEVLAWLSALPSAERVLLVPERSAGAFMLALGDRAVLGASPVSLLKAVKNDVQIEGFRRCMVRDGVAMVKAYVEIERRLALGQVVTEIDADELVHGFRRHNAGYRDKSFGSASAYGPNGAIVHYEADERSNATLATGGLWLYDSGVNYIDGTTDITRTISLGEPTREQRTDFTLVMKGHIAIATAVFPEGTRGAQLDALARMPLWQHGLSYLHGTGHGVGHYLNVHEGPQSIRLNDTMAPLMPGMVTSNEPGLYREGKWGIRCENLVLTVEAMTTEFGRFYEFETLTLFPFDRQLFDVSLMTKSEIDWVDAYHAMVRQKLLPHLSDDEQATQWLITHTQPLI